MNVLFIAEYFPPIIHGGGEINLQLLVQALAGKRVSVTVLTAGFSGLSAQETVNGVRVLRLLRTSKSVSGIFGNMYRLLFFERSVVQAVKILLKTGTFDVIHLIGSSLGCVSALMRVTQIPIVATIESYIALCPKGDFLCGTEVLLKRWSFFQFVHCLLCSSEIGKVPNRFYLKYNPLFWLLCYSRFLHLERSLSRVKLLAVSEFVQDILRRHYGMKSTVVPNFVDDIFFAPNTTKVKKDGKEKPVVVYLGALNEHKGVRVLLEAVRGLSCRLEIYGDGPLRVEVIQLIKQHGIDGDVYRPVPYDTVITVYKRADVVVFPSLWPEPFGRIAIEAQAAGVPVIGSGIAGIHESIFDGHFLFPPGDAHQLRNVLQMLISDHSWQNQQKNIQNFVRFNYSKTAVVHGLINFYTNLTAKVK